jgi:glyoxylase-like metal-dependent hydrolase (beta-lactamase superfamily II)
MAAMRTAFSPSFAGFMMTQRTVLIVMFLALIGLFATTLAQAAEFPKVGHYTSSAWGFSTNSFWLEGPTGVVLVDTQFLPSATEELLQVAERYTGKKVLLAVVLHANPDKFNGTGFLQARGIRVITSAQVLALIPSVDSLRRKWFYQRYQPDYPAKLALPESFGSTRTLLKAAGLTLELNVLGAATSNAHVVLRVADHVFVGDLLANKHHSWLELGLIDEWQGALREIAKLKPKYLYPGRGYPSDASLLKTQSAYLTFLANTVQAAQPKGEISDAQQKQLVQTVSEKYSGYQNAFFVESAVKVLWQKYAAANQAY